jgi:outer membrane receptor for ferrienterochelin and colicins
MSAEESNALVEIDGKPVGFTPALITGIAVGTRRLRLVLPGFSAVERDIEIAANSIVAASREAENVDYAPASVSVIPDESWMHLRIPPF